MPDPVDDERLFPVRLPRLGGEVLLAAAVSWLWATFTYRLWDMSWRVPLNSQGDARLITNLVKNVADHGWWTTNPDLGVPVGQQLYDFPHGGETWQMVLIRTISVFTDDPGLVMNIYFFTGIGVTAAAAYLALRHLRFSVGLALVAATALAWLPFRIGHGEYHLFRTSFWWVPLSVVIVVWALHWRERFLIDPEREAAGGWRATLVDTLRHNLRRRRVLVYVVMLVVLAGSETMTTAFTLTLLALTGLVAAIRRRDPAALLVHGLAIAVIGVVVVILMSPTLRFVAAHGTNAEAGRREVTEQEQFGLKISSLLLPDPSHRWPLLGRPEARILESTPIPSEAGQTIGLLGAAGFFGAVFHSLTRGWGSRRRDRRPPHDRDALRDDLGLLVVIATLVATVSGGAILLSLAGFSQVRVWNRMSLVIGFSALAYALTWFEGGWRLIRARVESTPARDRAWPRQIVGVVLTAALVGFVLWDGAHVVVDHRAADERWENDRDFVAAIDEATPDGTAVFQLPVTPFPEAGPVYEMHDYDHLRAFVHTEDANLLWSYGAMRGRPDGDWQLTVRDGLGEVDALPALLGAGFDGLWVDTFGYADRGAAVRADLDEATGVDPIVSADGRTLYYDLRPLRASLNEDGTSDADLRQIARDELGLDIPEPPG
jgi:phosphoglycerol transferase